jgi:hypothetical protein
LVGPQSAVAEKVDRNQDVLYGGQAIIEGVMMRGPRHLAMACRKGGKPNDEIVVETERVGGLLGKFRLLRLPLLRGVFAMIDALAMGIRALSWSANLQMAADREQRTRRGGMGPTALCVIPAVLMSSSANGGDAPPPPASSLAEKILIAIQIPVAIGLVVLLFFVLPNWALSPLRGRCGY